MSYLKPLPLRAMSVVASLVAFLGGCGGGGAAAVTASASGASSPATAQSATTAASQPATSVASQPAASSPSTSVLNPFPTARSGVGLNLTGFDYFASGFPTIDLMKRAGPWLTQCSPYTSSTCKDFTSPAGTWDTREEASLDLDANGWVRSLPASGDTTVKYRYVTTEILSGGTQPAGKYVVKYDGSGTLSYSGVASKVVAESAPGRDVVNVTSNSASGFFLSVMSTDPTNYVRNIRVYPPGGACGADMRTYVTDPTVCTGTKGAFVAFEDFPAGAPWHPQELADVAGFRTLRFMDWARTNSTPVKEWSERTTLTSRTWAGPAGVPVEAMLNLAQAAGAEAWVNLPPYASDDYVHQWAKAAHAALGSVPAIDIEYANEPWNYAFPATQWMLSQAKAAWPDQVTQGTSPYLLENNWYARRLVQVCKIVKTEFGADASRVRCVANTQAASPGVTSQTLACTVAAAELGAPCGKLVDAVAIAPYFGYYIGQMSLRPTVANWYTDPDGGLDKLFEEITALDANGQPVTPPLVAAGSNMPNGALGAAAANMRATRTIADTYGLPMWAYEAGQHLLPAPGDNDTQFLSLIVAANRDARMGSAYARNFSDWKASGGQTIVYYDHVGVASKFGMWGLKQSPTDDASPKWQAVTGARATQCWWSGC